MSANTKIEWADHTFNPWIGCTKVGPGCDHCYAEADFDKRRKVVQWGAGQPRKRTAASTWAQPLRWNAEAERLGVRYRVFCASLADVFDNEVPNKWRADLFTLIQQTPHLDWLLLTKRIGNVVPMLRALAHGADEDLTLLDLMPLPNVWIGATITNQAEADRDIPKLLAVPAAKRFLSMEPLLGPVDIVPYIGGRTIQCGCGWRRDEHFLVGATLDKEGCAICNKKTISGPALDWVIVGGESGPNARPMHPDWARSLRDQCESAGVSFLFKQWGEWAPADPIRGISLGDEMRQGKVQHLHAPGNPEGFYRRGDAYVRRVGKKAAGRLLDGREWNEVPA